MRSVRLVAWATACAAGAALAGCERSFDCSRFYTPAQTASAAPVRELTFHDPALPSRDLPMRLFAPAEAHGALPFVVFSAGLGPVSTDFDYLGEALAAHGYLFAVVLHPESSEAVVCANVPRAKCWAKLEETDLVPANWKSRVADLRAVIDDAVAHGIAGYSIDSSRIAAAGHSTGAFTSLAVAGSTFVDPRSGERIDATHPLVRAAMGLSPEGRNLFGQDEHSWSTIRVPVLLLTGDHDGSTRENDTPEWRREPFALMPPGKKYLLRLAEGDHLSFVGRERRQHLVTTNLEVMLAFLDAHLLERPEARAALASNALDACSAGHASLTH